MDVRIDDGIHNTLSNFSEHLSDYTDLYMISVYIDILDCQHVQDDVKERVKKQLNKEIMRHLTFEEEYDKWFKENVLTEY